MAVHRKRLGQERNRIFAEAVCTMLSGRAPDVVFVVGVGRWREGEVLLNHWPNALYVGVEPQQCYREHSRGVGFPGVIYDCAAGSDWGVMRLYGKRERLSAFQKSEDEAVSMVSPVVPLDAIADREGIHGMKTLLWMDCEGSELDALHGAAKLIESVRWLVCEVRTAPDRQGWVHAKDVCDHAEGCGLHIKMSMGKFTPPDFCGDTLFIR